MWRTCLGLNGFASSEQVYGSHFELEDILSHAHDLGYDGIELYPFHEPYPDTPARQRALKRLYQQYGLATPALQAETSGHAASPDRKLRDVYVESVQRMLDLAHVIDATLVGIWSGVPLPDVPATEQMRWTLDTVQRCTTLAEKAAITLALEAEPVQVVDSLEDMLYLLEGVPSPTFTCLYDFSHATVLTNGRPVDFLNAVKGRVGHVHFTDNDGRQLHLSAPAASHSSKHLAVGDGNLALDAIIAALRSTGYAGWMQVDVWENPDPYRASRLGKQYLDRLAQARA